MRFTLTIEIDDGFEFDEKARDDLARCIHQAAEKVQNGEVAFSVEDRDGTNVGTGEVFDE